MSTIYSVYDQIAEMIARLDPAQVRALRASAEMQQRFEDLLEKMQAGPLSRQEKDELDHFIVLERLFRLAKIRADHPQPIA
jgi:hypothetical protein